MTEPHFYKWSKLPYNVSRSQCWGEVEESDAAKERNDITWPCAQPSQSSPSFLLLWLLAASCRARMVPSSATNQRSPILAEDWRRQKSQHSRNSQRRRCARGKVRCKILILHLLWREGQACHQHWKSAHGVSLCVTHTGRERETWGNFLSVSFVWGSNQQSEKTPHEYSSDTRTADMMQYKQTCLIMINCYRRLSWLIMINCNKSMYIAGTNNSR